MQTPVTPRLVLRNQVECKAEMLYELIAIVSIYFRPLKQLLIPPGPARQPRRGQRVRAHPQGNELSKLSMLTKSRIARTTGSLILKSGGTIRGIRNWGIFSLPKRTRKHQAQYKDGHYFIMRYDASSKIQDDVRKTLGLDPRMIKFSSVKMGDGTLESLSKIGGTIPWETREEF